MSIESKEGDLMHDQNAEIDDLVRMVVDILKSGTPYAFSLAANIRSFHDAVLAQRQLKNHEERIRRIEERHEMEARLRAGDPQEDKEELLKKRAV